MKQNTIAAILALLSAVNAQYEGTGSGATDASNYHKDMTTITATPTATAMYLIQTIAPDINSTGIQCPSSSGTGYTNKYGSVFTILCPRANKDKRATALKAFITQFSDCIDTCDPKTGCAGVTYTSTTYGCSGYKCLPAASGEIWAANLGSTSAQACGSDYRSTLLYDVALLHNLTVVGPNGTYTTAVTGETGTKAYQPAVATANAGSLFRGGRIVLVGLLAVLPILAN